MYATFHFPVPLFVFIFSRLKDKCFVFFLHASAGPFISFATSIHQAFCFTIIQWVPRASYFFSLLPFDKVYDFSEARLF